MEKRKFEVFKEMFDLLYLQHYRALLGSRLYAIFKEGEKFVLKPVKYAKIGDNAHALDVDDFSFLKNLPNDYKRQLMSGIWGSPYSMSDLSYDDYIKTYEPSIEDGKPLFKDKTWGLYVNPLYAIMVDHTPNYSSKYFKKASRIFEYLSFGTVNHRLYDYTDDLVYVAVDSAMGLVIGGDVELREETYWHKNEQWKKEHWNLNFFTTNVQCGLTELFEDFCKKNYKKDDESGLFYVIPYRDIEKWDVFVQGRYYKLPIINKMYHSFTYDERGECRWIYPTVFPMCKDRYIHNDMRKIYETDLISFT